MAPLPEFAARPRIAVVVGTRPEAIKLAPVVRALRAAELWQVRVLATAQHRQMLDQALAFFGIAPDLDLDLMRPSQGLGAFASRALAALDAALASESPDLVVVQGDTTTVMMASLACFYRGIPCAHVEAGLRTGQRRSPFPEEMNRAFVGWLADLHLAPTAAARDHLLAEGVAGERIVVTGNPAIDALLWATERPLPATVGEDGRRLLLVTVHRRENLGTPLRQICDAVRTLVATREVAVLWPVHRNPEVHATVHATLAEVPHVRLTPPLDYPDFVAAMQAAHLVLTDSGGVQEEAPSLDVPVLVLRDVTERTEGVAAGTARLVGTERDAIIAAVEHLLDDAAACAQMAAAANPYGDGRAAARIAAAIGDFLRSAGSRVPR